MATHAVCPLCAKSSSLKSFPSGPGSDIILQSFSGLGRGKGFAVRKAGSGLEDERLCLALKPKVLKLVSALAERGYVEAPELASATEAFGIHVLTKADDHARSTIAQRADTLENEIRFERSSRELLEKEIADLETEVDRERDRRTSEAIRAAGLEKQLEQSRRAWTRLVQAYRESITSLRHLEKQLKGTPYADETLWHVVRNREQMMQLVQELRALSIIKGTSRSNED